MLGSRRLPHHVQGRKCQADSAGGHERMSSLLQPLCQLQVGQSAAPLRDPGQQVRGGRARPSFCCRRLQQVLQSPLRRRPGCAICCGQSTGVAESSHTRKQAASDTRVVKPWGEMAEVGGAERVIFFSAHVAGDAECGNVTRSRNEPFPAPSNAKRLRGFRTASSCVSVFVTLAV